MRFFTWIAFWVGLWDLSTAQKYAEREQRKRDEESQCPPKF